MKNNTIIKPKLINKILTRLKKEEYKILCYKDAWGIMFYIKINDIFIGDICNYLTGNTYFYFTREEEEKISRKLIKFRLAHIERVQRIIKEEIYKKD